MLLVDAHLDLAMKALNWDRNLDLMVEHPDGSGKMVKLASLMGTYHARDVHEAHDLT